MRPTAKNISALAIGFLSLAAFCRVPKPASAQGRSRSRGPELQHRRFRKATGDKRSCCRIEPVLL